MTVNYNTLNHCCSLDLCIIAIGSFRSPKFRGLSFPKNAKKTPHKERKETGRFEIESS